MWYNKAVKKIIIKIIVAILVIAGLGTGLYFNRVKIKDAWTSWRKINLPKSVSYNQTKKLSFVNGSVETVDIIPVEADLKMPEKSKAAATSTAAALPEEYNLNIPFTPQAPNKIWDETHKEACEEASVLMAARYINGKEISGAADADAEILKIVEWEKKTFGYWKDTDAAKTAEILKKYYGFKNTEVKYNITLDDIKKEVVAGHPVIVPAAGRLLGNPFYTPPGPLYHMLVVKGFTKDKIITNDPGTKNGENYVYENDIFYSAMRDWNGGDVMKGRRAMIIVIE